MTTAKFDIENETKNQMDYDNYKLSLEGAYVYDTDADEIIDSVKFDIWNSQLVNDSFDEADGDVYVNHFSMSTHRAYIEECVSRLANRYPSNMLKPLKVEIYKGVNAIINRELNGIRFITKYKSAKTSIGELLQS